MPPSRRTLAPPMLQTNKMWPGGTPGVVSSPGEGMNPGLPRITHAATQAVITKLSIGRLPSPTWTQAAGFLCRCFPDTRPGSRGTSVTFTPKTLPHLVGGDLPPRGWTACHGCWEGQGRGRGLPKQRPWQSRPRQQSIPGSRVPQTTRAASHQPERQSWGPGLWVKELGASAWLTDSPPHPQPASPGEVPEPGTYRPLHGNVCVPKPAPNTFLI